MSQLMTPLFRDGNFNRCGTQIRAEFLREVSNGTESYRLWRRAGKPEIEYPRAQNDAYILYVEIGAYITSLRMTEYALIIHCGSAAACDKLYGGKEKREAHFHELRIQANATHDESIITQAIARENDMTLELGDDPKLLADYIKEVLDGHVELYCKAVKNNGDTFPDFIGALVLDELDSCIKLRAQFQEKDRIRIQERKEREAAENAAFCKEKNDVANEVVQKAISILKNGGTLENDQITFYEARYEPKNFCVVNYLLRHFHVEVALRTQGWINEKLVSITVKDGRCSELVFRRTKGGRCSGKIFEIISQLFSAICNEKTA